MKKLLTLLLTLLMVFTLVGCNSTKEEEPVVVDTPQTNEPETKIEEPVVTENTETKQEESVDPTKYSYWVVFKNPDGNELQRTIEKYGTTPVYTGDTPVYWDSENWYRFTNWDQELKPIVTNTYITAEYEYGGELKKEEPASTPVPSNLVTINLSSGITDGHMDPDVSSIQVPIGTTYSVSANTITIGGVVYTSIKGTGEGDFSNWTFDPAPTTSGVITEDCTISAIYMPI